MRRIIVFALASTLLNAASVDHLLNLSPEQLQDIGTKIWNNECNNSVELLTFWHKDEAFPSLGIGHCIWLPAQCKEPYVQTFPDLLVFLQEHNVTLPDWLTRATTCPWATRDAFYAPENKQRLSQLRALLRDTVALQTEFMVRRLVQAWPAILRHTPAKKQAHVTDCFDALMQSPQGIYALVDYVNFKGDGTNSKERYAGYGWGLLQVLEHMQIGNGDARAAFVSSAQAMLERRVAHATRKEAEQRALIGWLKRINTYSTSRNF